MSHPVNSAHWALINMMNHKRDENDLDNKMYYVGGMIAVFVFVAALGAGCIHVRHRWWKRGSKVRAARAGNPRTSTYKQLDDIEDGQLVRRDVATQQDEEQILQLKDCKGPLLESQEMTGEVSDGSVDKMTSMGSSKRVSQSTTIQDVSRQTINLSETIHVKDAIGLSTASHKE